MYYKDKFIGVCELQDSGSYVLYGEDKDFGFGPTCADAFQSWRQVGNRADWVRSEI